MRVLLTGGAGYIGSHTYLALRDAGHEPAILDNFSCSSPIVLDRLEELSGAPVPFHEADVRDAAAVRAALQAFRPDCVIHFAGLKSVTESVANPLDYYDNNVVGAHVLLREMAALGIKKIVFSSTAAVYGVPKHLPITVEHPASPVAPYGSSKLMVERIITDLVAADPEWSAVLLRYFNPVGAHKSGRIGESPNGIPNNLVPYIAMVAAGTLKEVSVFGDDFETHDGTGVRDYIHITDLASGHVAALAGLSVGQAPIFNLGTGRGNSVLEVIRAYEKACGHTIPYVVQARRAGDVGEVYADVSKAADVLRWRARHDISDMCRDSWAWQSRNPNGYC